MRGCCTASSFSISSPSPNHTCKISFLQTLGVISLEHIFIDGTKIESVANKYKFIWKKTVLKKLRFWHAREMTILQKRGNPYKI